MSQQTVGESWTWAAMEPEPTEAERNLLDLFCQEFLVDGNEVLAASRCGFMGTFAAEYGKRFITRSYVQRRIAELRQKDVPEKVQTKYDRKLALNTLRTVASDQFARSAARVAAARELSAIHGFHAPAKSKVDQTRRSGVLIVKSFGDLAQTEAAARASQKKLIEESKVD